MPSISHITLPATSHLKAPDGSEVRVLLSLNSGSMAHFTLPPGQTSHAVRHRTVEEIWYILTGQGEMWQSNQTDEEIIKLNPGTCLTISVQSAFQFRNTGEEPLTAVAITMPPWPGPDEAEPASGPWPPTT